MELITVPGIVDLSDIALPGDPGYVPPPPTIEERHRSYFRSARVTTRIMADLLDLAVAALFAAPVYVAARVTRDPIAPFGHVVSTYRELCANRSPTGYAICVQRYLGAHGGYLSHYLLLATGGVLLLWLLLRIRAIASPRKKASWGMRILGLQVVTYPRHHRVGFVRSLWRTAVALALLVSVAGVVVDLLLAAFDDDHRPIHDVISATVVVQLNR